MQRIGDSTTTANGSKEFTHGQPASGVDATILTADWLNAIQRELVNLILGAGMAIAPGDDSQVLGAIKVLQAAAGTWAKLAGKPSTVSGFGITDAFTKSETTTAIQKAVADLVASSPAALDTLKELADALGNDPNFATTMTNALANKADRAATLAGYGISTPSQAEAESQSGQDNSKPMTALRVWQAIVKKLQLATQSSVTDATAGRLMQVGAGGLMGAVESFSDANTIPFRTGFFGATDLINGPSGANAGDMVIQIVFNTSAAVQQWFCYSVDKVFFRRKASGFFSAWQEMVHSGSAPLPTLGVGQTYQDMTSSRSGGVTYTNSQGRSIALTVYFSPVATGSLTLNVNGVAVGTVVVNNATSGAASTLSAIVPPGATYSATLDRVAIAKWMELR